MRRSFSPIVVDGWMNVNNVWFKTLWRPCTKCSQGDYTYLQETYQPCWMWFQNMLFCMCERCYFPKCYCWRDRMVRLGNTTDVTAHCAIFLMWMVKLTHHWQLFLRDHVVCFADNLQGLPLCWLVIDVPKVGTWDFLCHDWKKHWLEYGFILMH
jgi:hypothetical protein